MTKSIEAHDIWCNQQIAEAKQDNYDGLCKVGVRSCHACRQIWIEGFDAGEKKH